MLDLESRKVLLAVGNNDVEGGADFAVAEARRRGVGIHVVHAVPLTTAAGEPLVMATDGETLCAVGGQVLTTVARRLEHQLEDLPVSTELFHGSPVVAIVGASRHAAMVVLEHGAGLRRRVPTLSVTNAVAAHAHAPVAAVPAGWRGDAGGTGVVVGGLGDAASTTVVARCALAEGRARGSRVRLVHAWRFDDYYDGIVLDGAVGVQYEEKVRRELTAALTPLLAEYPDVTAELLVVHDRPADVLVAESVRSDLVVLARHRSTVPWGPHLGSTVRAVLRESAGPVLVVDPETVAQVTNGPAAAGERP